MLMSRSLSCILLTNLGIGSRCSKDLQAMGIETVNQLALVTRDKLTERFGIKQGNFLADISLGIDNSEVNTSNEVPKSISEEESFRKLTKFEDVKIQMKLLIRKLMKRLAKDCRVPKTIKLSVRSRNMQSNFARVSRQAHFDPKILKLENKERLENNILDITIALFDKMFPDRENFDLAVINICYTNFEERNSCNLSKFFSKEVSYDRNRQNAWDDHDENSMLKSCKASLHEGFFSQSKSSTVSFTEEQHDKYPKECSLVSNSRTFPHSVVAPEASKKSAVCESDLQSSKTLCESQESKQTSASETHTLSPNIGNYSKSLMTSSAGLQKPEKPSEGGTTSHQINMVLANLSNEVSSSQNEIKTLKRELLGLQSSSHNKHEGDVQCPAGIDSNVFRELPSDIQNELQQSWKRKEHEVVSVRSKAAQPRKKQKKNSAETNTKSILNYFSK